MFVVDIGRATPKVRKAFIKGEGLKHGFHKNGLRSRSAYHNVSDEASLIDSYLKDELDIPVGETVFLSHWW